MECSASGGATMGPLLRLQSGWAGTPMRNLDVRQLHQHPIREQQIVPRCCVGNFPRPWLLRQLRISLTWQSKLCFGIGSPLRLKGLGPHGWGPG